MIQAILSSSVRALDGPYRLSRLQKCNAEDTYRALADLDIQENVGIRK